MNKKIFFSLVIISLVGVFAFYFLSRKSNNEKITINILGENSATIQAMMSLESDYETKNPNIDLVFHPNTFEDAFNKSNQDFINGTALYDIVMQYNFSLASFVQNDYVFRTEDLIKGIPESQRLFEDDLLKNNWKEVGYYYKDYKDPTKGESMIAYPFSAHSMLLMYNIEMFNNEENKNSYKKEYDKELIVPENWDDLYNVSKFFSDQSKNTYGICLGGANDGYLYYTLSNFIYGNNGQFLEKEIGWQGDINTKVNIVNPENETALSLFKSLKPYSAGNFSSISQYEALQYMLEGNTAMSLVWSDLIYPNTFKDGEFDARFGYSPIPGKKSIYIGGAYFISKQSKIPNEALKYILYLHNPENQALMAQKGLCPSSLKTYDNPKVKALPYALALKESLERGGVLLEAGPDANMINEVITNYVQKCWAGEINVPESLELIQKEIEIKRNKIFKQQQ